MLGPSTIASRNFRSNCLMPYRGKRKGEVYAKLRPEVQSRLERLGRERALILKTLVLTGLRKGELASLAVGQVALDADPPYLILNAADEKNREGSTLPLHALRHTFGTLLSAAVVAPRTAQAAMRHASIDLTMNVYTDPKLLDVAAAMDALPALSHRQQCHQWADAGTIPHYVGVGPGEVLPVLQRRARPRGLGLPHAGDDVRGGVMRPTESWQWSKSTEFFSEQIWRILHVVIVGAALRPRETFEGSRGPLVPSI
jgi:hypothetical protein